MEEKILFIDDEANVLDAIKRQLFRKFDILTANCGETALEIMKQSGPIAVVVCDMRMPGMDGIQVLQKIQETSPDTIRLMLTGNADQQTAIDAVNRGNVFRFMNKPTSRETLIEMLEAASKQYRLQKAEQELLQGTLNGTISLLTELMSLSGLPVCEDLEKYKFLATQVAISLRVQDTWQVQVAVMLSKMAYMTLPPEILEKLKNNIPLEAQEAKLLNQIPAAGQRLLAHIPRLNEVADIILYQNKHFDGTGFPDDSVSGSFIPMESRILKVINALQEQVALKNHLPEDALKAMARTKGHYDPDVIEAVRQSIAKGALSTDPGSIKKLLLEELEAGQVLATDVRDRSGRILFTAGQKLNATMLERLFHFNQLDKINEPLMVSTAQGET